jgi:phosphatidylserine/phosphatidylglycerophosphate/cardiolipin synthase-like enzyme
MKRIILGILFFFLLSTFYLPLSFGLPAEDVQLVTDAQYFQAAKKLIQEAKQSIQVMMFEMGYYEKYPNTPSNLLIKELIDAKKRGVKVEVILEVKEGEDRTTKRNRHTGKVLSEGGVEVIYDPLFKTTHAKFMVVDGHLTLLGSTNWTYYALTNNNEASVLIRSKEIAKELVDYFNCVKTTGSKK